MIESGRNMYSPLDTIFQNQNKEKKTKEIWKTDKEKK